ncbi:oncoprotein-induced transcript 3 protein-like [Mercenaria mercenaria]|uniref:oncoprotein-induced transcript 3 protein-like n=1 Tax=Mercenaria mercenaria TaxID=6596 RepID=UPI00234EBE0E|nr:oncoprotein-induced transcript 3 protein-like [Mercenaria mercenaria]
MSFRIAVFYVIIYFLSDSGCFADPCNPSNHEKFPDTRMGSRNERCPVMPGSIAICDYFLDESWYVADEAVLLNKCPKGTGQCGVAYPAFLDGDFPDVTDGIVNRSACVMRGSDCCRDIIPIKLKNCSGFYAYHLQPLKECSSAYCFASSLPCTETTTEAPTSTTTIKASKGNEDSDDSKTVLIGTTVGVGVVLCLTTIVVAIVVIKTGWMKTQKQVSASKVAQPHIDHIDCYDKPPVYS